MIWISFGYIFGMTKKQRQTFTEEEIKEIKNYLIDKIKNKNEENLKEAKEEFLNELTKNL